jgi:hypothetical protein
MGKLKCETERVAKSISGLETLRPELEDIEKIESLEEGLASLRLAVEKLRGVKDGSEQPPSSPTPASPNAVPPVLLQPTPTPSASSGPQPTKSQSKVAILMNRAKPLEGIISYLTTKHGGNVHEKGIVTITSKSDSDYYSRNPQYAPRNVADLTSDLYFHSDDTPGQWICWDFREMRVRPTQYTITASNLTSWVVEGSLDGSSWTEIDRKADNLDFLGWNTASCAVSKRREFRFIRLTQTARRLGGDYCLPLRAVEFFGTLSE